MSTPRKPQFAAALLLVAAEAATAHAAQVTDDPFSMVREEQTVTAALKRPQPISETPSSVTVITAAEIRANGYHTLGEALRWVRGLTVTYDRNYYYLGVRGLQRPGDYANKVLLALDGHTLNGNVYGDAYFDADLGLNLEDVERIEVVRGPGSTLYGSYAVLAVVNVVTRRPRSEPGVSVGGWGGGAREGRGYASVASARPGRPEWRISGSWLNARGPDLFFPEYDQPSSLAGRAIGLDGESAVGFLGSAEWSGLRLAAKFNERRKTIPTGAFGTVFGDPRNRTWDGHDFVELAGTRQVADELELHGRAWWDGARYHGTYVYEQDSARVVDPDVGEGDVLGTEWRANWSAGRHSALTLGLEGQLRVRAHLKNYVQDPFYLYYDENIRSRLGAVYLQDETRFANGIRLTAGARLDGYSSYQPVVSPRLDLVWRVAPGTTWKVLTGTAFRAPTPYESDLYGTYGPPGTSTLRPERVASLETSLEHTAGALTAIASAYGNRIQDLIDLVEVDSVGNTRFQNRARVDARGVEGELQLVVSAATRVRGALAWQLSRDHDTGAELSNSARWNAHLVASHAPLEGPWSLGLGVRYLSSRITLPGWRTAAALVADARVARRFARDLTLGVEAKNLLDARYGDPGSEEHAQGQILQDPRTLYLTATLRARPAR
ncbi:MAG: TonB-dependent receptor [Candidatus Eisenbacteria bacterium]|nr:TonB-dependent receptor [Candidatus Eisenbacteria bacterium]